MPARPTPAPRPSLLPVVDRLDCPWRSPCLGIAVAGGWKHLDCRRCEAYSPISDDQRAADVAALVVLGIAVMRGAGGDRKNRKGAPWALSPEVRS